MRLGRAHLLAAGCATAGHHSRGEHTHRGTYRVSFQQFAAVLRDVGGVACAGAFCGICKGKGCCWPSPPGARPLLSRGRGGQSLPALERGPAEASRGTGTIARRPEPSLLPPATVGRVCRCCEQESSAPLRGTMGNQLAPLPAFVAPLQALHVVVVGLDAAGKTSLLYRLKFQEFVRSVPTKGFNMEKIRVPLGGSRAITLQVWDVGGQEKLRPLWKSYTRCTDGLVFVVDSAEAERLEEARVELHRIARASDNQGVPVLVLANKQDAARALLASEVEKGLGLHELGASTLSHVQGCSALSGLGLQQGLEKLYEMILHRKKVLRHTKRRC
ncbi:ADP-ribosylation factor-like protein 4D isoform X1 [Paroedura picta]|uniref:ADP-ribosylation factor-like protein 4D isoform X1 n=2 Tax=Paroedura picta TaxID=143630 RepID=UPI0040571F91